MTDVQTAAPTSSARTLMMRRCVRLAAKALLDASLVAVAFSGAVLVRFGVEIPRTQLVTMRHLLPYVVVLKLLTFFYFRLGRDLWRYASFSSLVRMARAIGIASLLVVTFTYLVGLGSLPRSVFVVDGVFTLLLIAAPRLLVRWLRERSLGGGGDDSDQRAGEVADGAMEKVLLVGAGEAGELMARDMNAHARKLRMRPIGFVDDNPGKQGMLVHGLPVLGGREAIPVICDDFSVARIVLCMPYVAGKSIREIIRYCHLTGVRVDIMPRLGEILSGRAKISDLRAVKVEDLLGRAKIDFNMDDVCSYVQGRRVLVTGAGGSIGSELCRQIVRYGPAEIGLLGRGENSIFSIAREISRVAPGVKRHEIIGDVINRRKLEGVFAGLKPEIIFHAGADKHVPLMELNPDEAVLNNIIGTSNVLQVADEAGTELVVAISTDKAVRPSSVMGCCKRVAEMLIQSGRTRRVKAVAVRFGNVLGSRGSVIPTFQHQIDQGGPVTVTHPRMERYFMTIPEAAALVLQAGAFGDGGEVFVLDMGEPVLIADLARQMIRLAGLEPGEDIPVVFSGLRPGEKLTEEIEGPGERFEPTPHPKIRVIRPEPITVEPLAARIIDLQQAAIEMDFSRIRTLLQEVVREFPGQDSAATHRVPGDGGLDAGASGREH